MNSRFRPSKDTKIIDDVFTPANMDPSVRTTDGKAELSSKLVIDATEKGEPGSISLPPKNLMMKALEAWKEIGLPEIEVSKRVQLILHQHL